MHSLKLNTYVTNVTDEIKKNRGHNIQFQYNFLSDCILHVPPPQKKCSKLWPRKYWFYNYFENTTSKIQAATMMVHLNTSNMFHALSLVSRMNTYTSTYNHSTAWITNFKVKLYMVIKCCLSLLMIIYHTRMSYWIILILLQISQISVTSINYCLDAAKETALNVNRKNIITCSCSVTIMWKKIIIYALNLCKYVNAETEWWQMKRQWRN